MKSGALSLQSPVVSHDVKRVNISPLVFLKMLMYLGKTGYCDHRGFLFLGLISMQPLFFPFFPLPTPIPLTALNVYVSE